MRKILVFASLLLAGCGPFGIISTIGGATLYLGYQHSKAGGLKYRVKDFMLESRIDKVWQESNLDEPFLKVYAVKGVPVIVGAATSHAKLEEAKSLALMKSDNMQCLADEGIKGGWNSDLEVYIRFQFTMNWQIAARNYHIKAIKNRVWIVGVAQNEAEKQAVLSKMQVMKNVESFSYHIVVSPDYLEPGFVEIQPNNIQTNDATTTN